MKSSTWHIHIDYKPACRFPRFASLGLPCEIKSDLVPEMLDEYQERAQRVITAVGGRCPFCSKNSSFEFAVGSNNSPNKSTAQSK